MVLQSPSGTNIILMSDRGGGTDVVNANLVFDDAAVNLLPAAGIVSGTWKPTNTGGPDNFPAPGPGSVNNVNPVLSSFSGDLNGTWRLFIVDQFSLDAGSITSWSITFETYGALWSPATGLYINAGATIPYVAGTYASPVWARPATTTTYTVSRSTASCTSAPATVTVTVIQPITVTTQPANQSVCAGATANFSIVTTGNFQSYQWQSSPDGVTWTNIGGANNATLSIPNTTVAMSGTRYRVIVTNTCTTVTSSAVQLTVNALPSVTITGALPTRICLSDTAISLVGMGNPVGGSWSGIGVSGFNFIPGATAVGEYTLRYTYTNPSGCTASATIIAKVQDCPERIRLLGDDAVILYPNPNNGRFNIRVNSTLYNYLGMRVYTVNGNVVRTQNFGGLVYGRVVPVDLSDLAAATYIVKFFYDDGVRTSEKSFKVIVTGH